MSRDTQFLGFAASLAAEIADTDGWNLADVEKLIARRAYDLVEHALETCHISERAYDLVRDYYAGNINASSIEVGYFKRSEMLADVPDFTELPEKK